MRTLTPFKALALLPMLAGCAGELPHSLAPNFGEAVNRNMSLHIIDPQPPGDDSIAMSGERAGTAYSRYRTDKVKQPVVESTTGGKVGSSR